MIRVFRIFVHLITHFFQACKHFRSRRSCHCCCGLDGSAGDCWLTQPLSKYGRIWSLRPSRSIGAHANGAFPCAGIRACVCHGLRVHKCKLSHVLLVIICGCVTVMMSDGAACAMTVIQPCSSLQVGTWKSCHACSIACLSHTCHSCHSHTSHCQLIFLSLHKQAGQLVGACCVYRGPDGFSQNVANAVHGRNAHLHPGNHSFQASQKVFNACLSSVQAALIPVYLELFECCRSIFVPPALEFNVCERTSEVFQLILERLCICAWQRRTSDRKCIQSGLPTSC
jgi:hypothetical protein